jgi:hypothetical protein
MIFEDAVREACKFQSLVRLHSRFDESRHPRAKMRNLWKTDVLQFDVPEGTKRVILLNPPFNKKCFNCAAANSLTDIELNKEVASIRIQPFLATYSMLEPLANYEDSVANHASDIINWFTREELVKGYDFLRLLLEQKDSLPENITEYVEMVVSDFYVDNFFVKEDWVGFNMISKFGFCAIIPE